MKLRTLTSSEVCTTNHHNSYSKANRNLIALNGKTRLGAGVAGLALLSGSWVVSRPLRDVDENEHSWSEVIKNPACFYEDIPRQLLSLGMFLSGTYLGLNAVIPHSKNSSCSA